MSSPLLDFIQKQIAQNGPMDVGTYMGHILGHPKFGYYIRRDPFGLAGDFITAPEISQMFGEMIGAWAADMWMKLGSPKKFILLEGGPGRGTLMKDALRGTKHVPGFHEAMEIHMLETSPVLRQMQAETVKPHKIKRWHSTLASVPHDRPIIMIANELLDALPARQFEMTDSGWMERVVALLDSGPPPEQPASPLLRGAQKLMPNLFGARAVRGSALTFGRAPAPEALRVIPKQFHDAPKGSVFTFSSSCVAMAANIAEMIKAHGGAALLIDYGHAEPQLGDTLRAIYRHTVRHPLTYVGDADLSFHVDFAAVGDAAQAAGASVFGAIGQGAFLKNLGIEARAEALKAKANDRQKLDIEKALHRLCDSSQMGEDFKVMGFTHDASATPAGF